MDRSHLLVLDEGTTSTRAVLYDREGRVLHVHAELLEQHYPAPGLVEHDANQIWERTLSCARAVIEAAGGPERIAAIGITNQRETTVAWDLETGLAVRRAIVWQDRRTASRCEELRDQEDLVQRTTGLRLDPYFAGTKMAWLAQQPEAQALGDRLALGTIDSWLLFKLAGKRQTDVSNASRTLLMDLDATDWSPAMLDLFGVPRSALGVIGPCFGQLATTHADLFGVPIPICAMVGDQQSATIGQACLEPSQAKLTLGTGAFALVNAGEAAPREPGRLLGTVLVDGAGRRSFALEGSIFVAGSLMQWLRDQLGLIVTAGESEALAASIEDSGGVMLLPALAGLGAPYWAPEARGMVTGMSFATTRAHLARAALEAVTHQVVDLADEFAACGVAWRELRLDGGMSANNWLAQDLSDMLGIDVIRPDDVETTARGAAILASVGAGLYPDIATAAAAMRPTERRFTPRRGQEALREGRMERWHVLLRAAGVDATGALPPGAVKAPHS